MKKIIVLNILISFFSFSYSQIYDEGLTVSLETNQIKYENFSLKSGYGLGFQLYLSKHFSLNSHLLFGNNYIHAPGGIALMAISLTYGTFDGCLDGCSSFGGTDEALLILLALIFTEGVSFHLYPNDKLSLSPFINPLSLDYIHEANKNESIFLSASAGLRVNFYLAEKIVASPYIEYKYMYTEKEEGFGFGFSIGYIFDF